MGGRGTGRRACGRARRIIILTTGGGSGIRQSASHLSTIESHQWTTRPAPRYSRRPPVPAHSPLAHLSLYLSTADAGQLGGDWRLGIRSTCACRKCPGLVCCRCVSPSSPIMSLPPLRLPPTRRRLTEPIRSRNTDGQAGDPECGSACWSPAFDCTRRRRCCSTTNSSTL